MKKLFFVVAIAAACVALHSCNATRTVTTVQTFMQRGDTCVTIQTKTIESYDGSKK